MLLIYFGVYVYSVSAVDSSRLYSIERKIDWDVSSPDGMLFIRRKKNYDGLHSDYCAFFILCQLALLRSKLFSTLRSRITFNFKRLPNQMS